MAGSLPQFQPIDVMGMLNAVQAYKARQSLLPDQIAAENAQNEASAQQSQQSSALSDLAYQGQVLSGVAQQAQAADPANAASVWNEGMKNAASKGVRSAAQYVGQYRPDLADRVASIYGAQGPGGKGQAAAPQSAPGFDPSATLAAIQAQGPQKTAASLKNLNDVVNGFNSVTDEASWNQELQHLQQSGMNVGQFLDPKAPWQLQYAMVHKIIQRLAPVRDLMAQSLAAQAVGVPDVSQPTIMKVGSSLVSVDPTTGAVKPLYEGSGTTGARYQAVTGTMGPSGNPLVLDKTTGQYVQAPGSTGVPLTQVASLINGAENATGNPAATNPRSTAMGNGQFLNATWLTLVKAQRPDLVKGKTDAQILAMRSDPALSQQMTVEYARENSKALQDEGLPVTTASLTLSHRLGVEDAKKLLAAPPSTQLSDLLPKNVLDANPDMAGQTAGTYTAGIVKQVGNQPVATADAGIGGISVPGDPSLHGDGYLQTVPDQGMAAWVKAVVQGRSAQPSSFFLRTPQGQMLMKMAAQYEPGFDLSLYQARVKTQGDLATGKMGQNVTSFNTAIQHAARLNDAVDALGNTQFAWLNKPWQAVKNMAGDTQFQSAKATFEADKTALTDELTRAFRGTGGNVSDINTWEDQLDEAKSPAALHAAVKEGMHLLNGRIEAIGDQYQRGMRLKAEFDPTNLLSPRAKTQFNALLGKPAAGAQSPAGGATPAPAPPPGVPAGAKYSPSQHAFWWQENGQWKKAAAQ